MFGAGILGFITITDRNGQHVLAAIRADHASRGFLLDVTRDPRQGRATFTLPVVCDRDGIKAPDFLHHAGCSDRDGVVVVNGRPVSIRFQWLPAHPGSAIVHVPGLASCFLRAPRLQSLAGGGLRRDRRGRRLRRSDRVRRDGYVRQDRGDHQWNLRGDRPRWWR